MVWGTTEYQYTIHALGQVESSMDYGATNPTDYITVGLIQWYGTRAANVLDTMRSTNPTDWTIGGSALDTDLTAHSATDSFWNTRHLSLREQQDLHTIMSTTGNIAVQDAQAQSDISSDYIPAGNALGIDENTHPETMAFFINIYNRNPVGARRIVANCGPSSSLDRIYSFTLNDPSEGQFKSRYQTAYTIIAAHDTTGVGTGVTGTPPGEGNGGAGGGTRPTGKAAYVRRVGTQMHLINKDGTKQIFSQVKPDYWLASFDNNVGVPPVPGGGGSTPPTAITDILTWEGANLNAFDYSQAGGRLDPPTSGYTDCSGLQYYAYLTYADIDIGTWTGTQIGHGTLITEDPTVATDGVTVHDGDLVFYRWDASSPSSFDHVAIYKGSDQVYSHGGPDPGPDVESHSGNISAAISGGGSIMVRRYL